MALFAEVRDVPSAAPPLVMLHGFGGVAELWAPIIEGLDRRQPIIAYDLPGHGRSLGAAGAGHAGDMAKAILADLDQRGVERCHVVGHSMGGAIAALLAIRAPERVASLTMLAPGGFGPAINHRALKRFAEAKTVEELRIAIEPLCGFNGSVPDAALAAMADMRQSPDALSSLQHILKSFLSEKDGKVVQGALPLSMFIDLAMPIRLVWGLEDMILPVTQADQLPVQVTLTKIAGVGHMLIDEAPAAVLSAINANLLRA
ncbi:alpha/beta fold hydrolase [Peteryoungia desertarenae]|uniref:Alpha/beta fold hydrolase n=1 Tax=Peteryoungia desertarenae TaxID=1813451 RepID=A0ABX6QR40_9HYPH|nr:alpha/beta fold hydrolase [Peteryoungia desertarenae]QLF71013.1 alpha/beta fold hydrolase [Peteryoungia desertarenae]